jgi:hypothetical protein
MTKAEWLACVDPDQMVAALEGAATERKLRLLSVACCRRIWGLMLDKRARRAVEVAEQFADGQVGRRALAAAHRAAAAAFEDSGFKEDDPEVDSATVEWASRAAEHASSSEAWDALDAMMQAAWVVANGDYADRPAGQSIASLQAGERAAQAELVREVFGNPFRPVAAAAVWLSAGVTGLARTIYEERAFDGLPALADALVEVGCDDPSILAHCRQGGGHVRGCWAVDLLLDKESSRRT